MKPPTILKAAVESFVGDHGRGLPDVVRVAPASAEELVGEASSAASSGQVRREAARASSVARPPLVHVTNERQARLNEAKYGRSS